MKTVEQEWVEFERPWQREFFGMGESSYYWYGTVLKHHSSSEPNWTHTLPDDIQLLVKSPSGQLYVASFSMGHMKAILVEAELCSISQLTHDQRQLITEDMI